MLLSKTVKQKWNSNNKKRYIELGYTFTKMGDEFEISVEDLPNSSSICVDICCDYCGTKLNKPWYRYIRENVNTTISNDCCTSCKKYKIADTALKKYGVNSVLSLESVQEKVRTTNIKRYGCKNVFASDDIKQKIYNINLERYGSKYAMQNDTVKSKVSDTCMQRYGVSNILFLYHGKGEKNNRWRGGVEHHRQERSTANYVEWRNKVFVRDAYTCQCCGSHSVCGSAVILNAHHIYNWKDYPDLRYNADNGITLCVDCHNKFHSEFGKNNNTKSQLDEFLYNHGKKIC